MADKGIMSELTKKETQIGNSKLATQTTQSPTETQPQPVVTGGGGGQPFIIG